MMTYIELQPDQHNVFDDKLEQEQRPSAHLVDRYEHHYKVGSSLHSSL